MSAPINHRHLGRPAIQEQRISIDARYQRYEMLKQQLTASARTPDEYDRAVREAARLAGV